MDPGSAVEVLVVGAGPTGLTMAAQLAAYGTRCRIVDRNLDRTHESRALAVQSRTLEVLAPLGVAGEMVELGNRAVRVRLYAGRRVVPIQLFDLGVDDTAYPYLLFLSQAETERILDAHLATRDVRVERGTRLVQMRQTGDAVDCTLRHRDGHEELVRARYVVGCDGAHSTVRQQAGIAFEGGAYPQTFVLADLEADGIEPDAAHAFLSSRGLLFFFPLGRPATWRVLTVRSRGDTTPVEQPVTLAEVQELTDACASVPIRLRDPVWMTNFRLQHRVAAHYRAGSVFLAGDAAHVHSPAGGQGMNTGIQDAVNLGWKLALVSSGVGEPRLLDTYEPERAPVGRYVLRFTDRAFVVATSGNPLVRFARTEIVPRLMPLVLRFRAGRRYGFRTISELAITYRGSELATDGPGAPRRGPRAGDRLPDVKVLHNGSPTTVHALTAAPGWHLLLYGSGWPDDPAAQLTAEQRGLVHAHRLDDARGRTAHVLVRPDGHIAYRAAGADLAGLYRYLDRWLPGASPPTRT